MSQQSTRIDPLGIIEPLKPGRSFFDREIEPEAPGFFSLAGEAINSEWAGAWAYRRFQRSEGEVDPDFNPYEDDDTFDVLTEGLATELWSGFDDASSMTHALVIRDQLMSVQNSRNILQQAGFKGAAISMGALVLDPVFLAGEAIGIGVVGGVANLATKGSRITRMVRGGMVVGVPETAITSFIVNEDPDGDVKDILYAGAGAFLLGGGANVVFGKAARRLQKQVEFEEMAQAAMGAASRREFGPKGFIHALMSRGILSEQGKRYFKELIDPEDKRKLADEFIDGMGLDVEDAADLRAYDPDDLIDSVSNAREDHDMEAMYDSLARPDETTQPPSVADGGDGTPPKTLKKAGDLFINATDAVALWAPIRWSIAGKLGSAKSSPMMRMSATGLAEDALRKQDGTANAANASRWGRRQHAAVMSRYYRVAELERKAWTRENNSIWSNSAQAKEEFYNRVGMAVRRGSDEAGDARIQSVANTHRELNKHLLNLATRHGVKGMDEVEANALYLTRLWSPAKLSRAIAEHGEAEVVNLLAGAFIKGSDELEGVMDDKLAQKIARGFLRTISKTDDAGAINRGRVFDGSNREALEDVLREEGMGFTETQIEDLLGAIVKPESGTKGTIARAKHRIRMDETYASTTTDNPFKIEDLLENNSATILELYSRQVTGASGMSEVVRSINEATGRVARRGDETPDELAELGPKPFETWDDVRKAVEVEGKEFGDPDLKKNLDRLDLLAKSVLGRRIGGNTKMAKNLRIARLFQHLRLSGQFGIAQIPEYGNIAGSMGFQAMYQQMPALREIFRRSVDGKLSNELLDELETLGIGGSGRLTDNVTTRMDEGAQILEFGGTGSVETGLRKAAKFSNDISLMAPITIHQQRTFALLAAQKFLNIARGGRKIGKKRMADMGLDEDMSERISKQLRRHATEHDGDAGRLKLTNLDEWDDIEAASRFVDSLDRWSGRAVQDNDIGNLAAWMTTDIGRVMVQFRTFTMNAWEKQFLQKASMHDWQSFIEASYATMIASLVYVGQQHVNSIGRSDKEQFLKERLGEGPLGFSIGRIAGAGAQRAGWTSILPSVSDSFTPFIGVNPLFNARNTNLSNNIWSNPSWQFVTSGQTAAGGAAKAVTGRDPLTQKDMRRIVNLLPFKQVLGVKNLSEAFIGQFPED